MSIPCRTENRVEIGKYALAFRRTCAFIGCGIERIKNEGTVEVLQTEINPSTNRPSAISNKKLTELTTRYLPIAVEGTTVEYQINRNKSGWVIELIHNDGVSKKGHLPAVTDETIIANITLTPRFPTDTYTIWRCGSEDETHRIDQIDKSFHVA